MSEIYDYTDKLCFLGEWYDHDAAISKDFIIKYYPADNAVELFDKELNRIFLKRSTMDDLTMDDLFVGNTIRVYGRQIKITGYLDHRTQNHVGKLRERTLAILKHNVIQRLGEIINFIQANNFRISRLIMCLLTRTQALEFYSKLKGDTTLPFLVETVISDPIVAMELVGDNSVERWKYLMGPSDPTKARLSAPGSLIATYGEDSQANNGFHGSLTIDDGHSESRFFFSKHDNTPEPIVKMYGTTCCVIKPHAIQEGNLGSIITSITDSQFKIIGVQMVYLTSATADEFLEVYKGVVSDYQALLLSFLGGPCVVLEIEAKNSEIDVHNEFRHFTGPSDVDIARQIRPNSLRAKYGSDRYKNAVHCTDLPEDTTLELEYLFKKVKSY